MKESLEINSNSTNAENTESTKVNKNKEVDITYLSKDSEFTSNVQNDVEDDLTMDSETRYLCMLVDIYHLIDNYIRDEKDFNEVLEIMSSYWSNEFSR